MTTDTEKLASDLIKGAYGDLFIYPDHENTINKIWYQKGNPSLLEELVKDESLPLKGRFLACVVLFSQEFTFVSRYDAKRVAEIYAQALEQNLTGFSNSWGLLYEHEDEGPIGITFIILGEASVPALIPLLQNENLHRFYIGSEEATVGNGYNFRVKDVAAYYIGRIIGKPLKYYHNLADRDEQINNLKQWVQT